MVFVFCVRARLCRFAAPRVGGSAFREKLAKEGVELLNVINAHDIVPIVPGSVYIYTTIIMIQHLRT